MARLARAAAPGTPHHVTQRGNRRQEAFFNNQDCQSDLELMPQSCAVHQVQIYAYCFMPNHIHLIVVHETKDALKPAIGKTHRRCARRVNFCKGWRGHSWQGRFSSFIMDKGYLLACTRYVELNPVLGGLVDKAQYWPWSIAGPHMKGKDDILVKAKPLLDMVDTSLEKFFSR